MIEKPKVLRYGISEDLKITRVSEIWKKNEKSEVFRYGRLKNLIKKVLRYGRSEDLIKKVMRYRRLEDLMKKFL